MPACTDPEACPAFCKMDTESFPGVKRTGRDVVHSPLSSAKVAYRLRLYLPLPSAPVQACRGATFTFTWDEAREVC
jgi:hypothetical protein